MKFIPVDGFSALNSLLQSVEAQGCCITLRLEAYTCRHTKEEKETAHSIAAYQTNVQMTPPIGPSLGLGGYPDPQDVPPLVLGCATPISPALDANINATVVDPDSLDDRLVYFVTALNMLYADDGYDFSVLNEKDFIRYEEREFRGEVQNTLDSLPERCQPAVQRFWSTVEGVVEAAAGGCEYYEFRCPTCDPLADSTVYSRHLFCYNRRRKVLALLVEYGESNPYRGDDGLPQPGYGSADWEAESPTYPPAMDPMDYEGKNRQFYGY